MQDSGRSRIFVGGKMMLKLTIMNAIKQIWNLYYDGFRSMTLGRTLWAVILVKLFIIFVVLKLFFFPNYIKEHADEGQEAEFVSTELLNHELQN